MDTNFSTEPDWYNRTIDLKSNVEIVFWCKMLRCSKRNLLKAISQIGNSPRLVDSFLELNRMKYERRRF